LLYFNIKITFGNKIPRKSPKNGISDTGGGILINVFFGGNNFGGNSGTLISGV